MRRACLIVVLAAVWFGGSTTAVEAQWWGRYSHHYYYGWPGYYGGYYPGYYARYDFGWISGFGGRRFYAQSQQLLGEQIAAQQAAATQRNIRYAMSADAQRRSDQAFIQQQADREWWLQTQQQQMADRQQAAALAAMTANSESTPKVATDLIRWPPVLQAPQYAEQRTRIEAPYRRGPKGLSEPTASDYRDMIVCAGQMRTIVKEMTASLTSQQYIDAQVFLDRLTVEARSHLPKAATKR